MLRSTPAGDTSQQSVSHTSIQSSTFDARAATSRRSSRCTRSSLPPLHTSRQHSGERGVRWRRSVEEWREIGELGESEH
eukprot:scaffold1507_cov134-Isochrysis_galbana.AAC.5